MGDHHVDCGSRELEQGAGKNSGRNNVPEHNPGGHRRRQEHLEISGAPTPWLKRRGRYLLSRVAATAAAKGGGPNDRMAPDGGARRLDEVDLG